MADDLYYKPGSHYVICDRTGRKIRREDARFEWTGALVAKDVWEPRHPQDFVRGRADKQAVPNARPRAPDVFVNMYDSSVLTDENNDAILDENGNLIITPET